MRLTIPVIDASTDLHFGVRRDGKNLEVFWSKSDSARRVARHAWSHKHAASALYIILRPTRMTVSFDIAHGTRLSNFIETGILGTEESLWY